MSAIEAGWRIRFYVANDYTPEGDVGRPIGNFKGFGSREQDRITVFSGEYGIDQYLVWEIHNNLPFYDFSTVALNLELYHSKNVNLAYWKEFYRVQNITYDEKNSRYILYAISEATVRLDTRLADYDVTGINWEEIRQTHKYGKVTSRNPLNNQALTVEEIVAPEPIQLLKDILQVNQIFSVVFHPDNVLLGKEIHFDYKSFNINPLTTIRDFIEYIAEECNYEWLVTKTIEEETNEPTFHLHIGHQLYASKTQTSTKKFQVETDFISDSTFFKKIVTTPSPMDLLSHWNDQRRCVWIKHTAGESGGNSWGCFVPMGWGHLEKNLYVRSLEGEREKNLGFALLFRRTMRFPSLTMGNIIEDLGNEYIEKISIQKDPELYHIKEPKDIVFQRGEGNLVTFDKQHVDRMTPYAEDGSALLFPSPDTTKTPANSVLGMIDGRVESPIHLGHVLGNGNPEFKIPMKNPKDFRFTLPNGWTMYVSESGDFLIDITGIDAETLPNRDITHMHIYGSIADSIIALNKDDKNFVEINFDITAESEGNIIVNASGDVEINCGESSNVSIKSGGIPVSLEGHTHPLGGHTHIVVPGPAIPGPPATAQTAQAVVQGETDKHSKHLKCVEG